MNTQVLGSPEQEYSKLMNNFNQFPTVDSGVALFIATLVQEFKNFIFLGIGLAIAPYAYSVSAILGWAIWGILSFMLLATVIQITLSGIIPTLMLLPNTIKNKTYLRESFMLACLTVKIIVVFLLSNYSKHIYFSL